MNTFDPSHSKACFGFENFVKFGVQFPKQNVKLPKNWNKIETSIYNGEAHFAVRTGIVNNIVVIDLDNKDPKFIGLDWFEKHFGPLDSINTLVTKTTNNGFHIFFQYTSKIKNITSNKFHIDILSDNRCCYQGTEYPIYLKKDIRPLTNKEIVFILSLKLNHHLSELINNLSPITSYDDWFKHGVSLVDFCKNKNISFNHGLEAFKLLSQLNPANYDEETTVNQWNDWCNREYTGNKITEKTIIKKSKQNKLLQELDSISQHPTIGFHNIKHIELVQNNEKQIIEALIQAQGLDNIHNMVCGTCLQHSLYSICSKDGYKVKCRNCEFNYPAVNIPINKSESPNIFNMIIIQDNNIKNKQTKHVAEYLLHHTKILYNNKTWYQFNEVSGIYEFKDELEILRKFDFIIETIENDGQHEEWFKWLDHINYQKNLLDELKKQCFSNDILDSNDFLLGFNNGVYDLQKGLFRKGLKKDFVSMKCGFDYDPDYSTKLTEQILHDIFPNNDECDFALCKLSLCLEGFNREQKITFNYGYTASNGKSFLMELMCQTLGDYGGSFPVTTITGKMKNAGEANSTISDFKNKRFLYCSEPEAGLKINSNYIKTLTGDKIKVRKVYATQEEELSPTYKMFMCCNALPNFDTYDEGIARRISLLEFKTRFCEEPSKKHEKLLLKYSKEELNDIQKGLMVLLINKYNELVQINFKYLEPVYLKNLCKLYINDNKNIIRDLLLDNFHVGEKNDYVKLKDIKDILKQNGVKEKDIITIKYIVEETFDTVEFKECSQVNNIRIKNFFHFLKNKV